MAVTNKQILLAEILEYNITEPIDTFPGWKRRGKVVKKGEKALFTTSIWKPCAYKDKETGEKKSKLRLVKASYFGLSQVTELETV